MKFTTTCLLAGVIGAPFVSATSFGQCPPSCTITTFGTPWDNANLRPTPCNNRHPLNVLEDGDYVYNLGSNKFGCGYWYTQVWDPSVRKVGWVASQFLDCGGNPPVPAAALASDSTDNGGGAV